MTNISRPRVLLVLHEATRTGAPVVAAALLERLRDQFEFEVATLVDGPLRTRLSARMWTDRAPTTDFDAVWCNGASSAAVLWDVDDAIPAVVFTHEMGEALENLDPRAADALRSRCDVVVAVSQAARQDLIRIGVNPADIEIIEPPVAAPSAVTKVARDQARAACGAIEDVPLVLCCGEAAWRKGPDLFVHVAARISSELCGEVRFAWIGRRTRSVGLVVDHDAELLGIGHQLRWIGEVADPQPYLAAADLVLLTSREDPHPLVPAEAALVGTATAAFDVGEWSLAPANMFALVAYPDVSALASTAVELLRSSSVRSELATKAADYVSSQQSTTVIADRFGRTLARLCYDEMVSAERGSSE